MSTLIETLERQHTTVVHGFSVVGEPMRKNILDSNRFVESIIRECYAWAKENGGISDSVDYDALKKHFGVEQ